MSEKPNHYKALLGLAMQDLGDGLALLGRLALAGDRLNGDDWGRCAELFDSAGKHIRETANAGDYNFRSQNDLTYGSKVYPGKYDCHTAALPDEPTFTLLARDPHAPTLILQWVTMREASIAAGERPEEENRDQILEARSLAEKFKRWRNYRMGAWRRDSLAETPE